MACNVVKAALYIRVSTEEQALEGQSVDAQIEVLKQYCKLYNIEIYEIYKDLGVSGKTARNRPGLQNMLLDASRGKFNLVLVWKLSRLSRSLKDLLLILDQLEKNKIVFSSYSEKFDTSTPVGRMTLQLLGSIAEFERNTIIDNVKLGLQEYARKGGKTGTVLGYDNINRQLIVNTAEAEMVKLIYKLYVINRLSMSDIAEYLNKNGYRTKRGKQYRKDSISVILCNPVYVGINRHKIGSSDEYQTKGSHQSIINADLWQAAQELRQSNKIKRPAKCEQTSFFLSGKLICPDCGSPMLGFSTKAITKSYRYYKCKSCKRLANASPIEQYVLNILHQLLQNRQIMQDTIDYMNSKFPKESSSKQLEQLEGKLQSCSKQMDNYISLLERDDFKGSNIITDKLKQLEQELLKLQMKRDDFKSDSLESEINFSELDYYKAVEKVFAIANKKDLKKIIDCCVKHINLDKECQSASISLAFNTSKGSIINFII